MEVSLWTGGTTRTLETVKVLHETILALRTALEGSKKELLELRSQNQFSARLHTGNGLKNETDKIEISRKIYFLDSMDNRKEDKKVDEGFRTSPRDEEGKVHSDAESDDIDDIELVFTTGETDPSSIHEDLVPILEDNVRKSTNTVVVETDISKCGVIDENEGILSARRNTLPDPLPYQPIIHREILAASRGAPARSPCKAAMPGTQETGAQTDITALPTQWKSETYLAHKMSCNLTTLPSKFTLPVPQAKRLPLSDKTREARRVLLSDINFTSMVPELSRSADHLHDEKPTSKSPATAFDYSKSPRSSRCCEYSRQESRSSCGSYFGSRCHTSSTSIPPFACEEIRRRHSWRPPHVFCCHSRQIWSSVPSSPTKCQRDEEDAGETCCHVPPRKRKPKVHFHHCDPCGQSLPNLRLEDSGDSTDSLVDEAEEFLRHSIDNLIVTKTHLRRRERRSSDTDSVSASFEPPKSAQPFLPKSVKDLKRDCFVKVITPDGRIAVGRVRYSGLVPGKSEPHVGVELGTDAGCSDGSFGGHRFFDCDPGRAAFVPFKKVVIAWSM